MSRKMVSPEQLEKKIDEKLNGYDKAIPTSIGHQGDEIYLQHDNQELTPQAPIHFKQLFGKHTLIGNGNIDLFIHHIKLTNSANAVIAIDYVSSNDIVVDSIQDLNTLFGTISKTIVSSSGYINWAGSFAATAGITAYTNVSDIMEAI